jgi:hypothetical protein
MNGEPAGGAEPLGSAASAVLRAVPALAPDDLAGVLAEVGRATSWLIGIAAYLSDYQERLLVELDGAAVPIPDGALAIEGTLAGRAFRRRQAVGDAGGLTWWLPLTNRRRRLGVVRLDVRPATDPAAVEAVGAELGALLGTLVDSAARCTDAFYRAKRLAPIALTAEMQWELLPPLCIAGAGVTLAGRLEPAYEVGGDSFDYSIDARVASVGIFDPLGHDLRSALLAALAVGSYRHARRSSTPLPEIGAQIDAAVRAQFPNSCFVTGQLAEVDLGTGLLRWTNAGHPLPILLRDNRSHEIDQRPDPPWGLQRRPSSVAEVGLQPGDRVLFYTDGLVEARSSTGERFGGERLADLLVRESLAERDTDELLRRLLDAVMAHRGSALQDDATAVIVAWQ